LNCEVLVFLEKGIEETKATGGVSY
jgi:hypothetical protein